MGRQLTHNPFSRNYEILAGIGIQVVEVAIHARLPVKQGEVKQRQ
jgi:hypothetical protein